MSVLIPIIIQLVGGAAGGNVVGALLKKLPVGKILATVLGAGGGLAGGQLAGVMEALQGFLGSSDLATAAPAAGGGAVLTLIVGLIKKAMAGGAAPEA